MAKVQRTVKLVLLVLLPAGIGVFKGRSRLQDVTSRYYLALPAAMKADRIWSNCPRDIRPAPPIGFFTVSTTHNLLSSMCPSFFTTGDELPLGRKKYIHYMGVVGRVKWKDYGNHPYTGIFKGAQHGFVRMSHTVRPNPHIPSFILPSMVPRPGIGLKFLRDGKDSANVVAVFSVRGQTDSWNFFKNDLSNHAEGGPGATEVLIAAKFMTGSRNVAQCGVSDMAKMGEDGKKVAYPNFPYRLRFHPIGNIRFPDAFQQQCQVSTMCEVRTIPAGTTLWRIFAATAPLELGGRELLIGEIVLTSHLTTSRWGDEGLFFRHQDMVEDLRIHPEWNNFTDQFPPLIKKSSPYRQQPCKGGFKQLGTIGVIPG